MRLTRFSVRGMTRFTDPVTVDLTTAPEGLIAVVGENGEGKTTLVETGPATILRLFPSRKDKDLFDYAIARDAYLESDWDLPGRGSYRLRVNLDQVKRTATAVVSEIGAQGQQLTALTDGKLRAFDATVADLFPPADVLLASAVGAQNKFGSFSSLDKAGKLQLLGRLLGLERYEAMAKLARQAAAVWAGAVGKISAQREVLVRAADAAAAAAMQAEIARLREATRALASEDDDLRARIESLDTVRDDHAAAAAAHLKATGDVRTLRERQAGLLAKVTSLEGQRTEVGTAAARQQADAAAELSRRVGELEARIRKNRTEVIERADAIRAAHAKSQAATIGVTRARAWLATLEERREEVATKTAPALTAALAEAERAEHELVRLRQDAAAIDGAPFGEKCGAAKCGFLVRALDARDRVPAVEALAADAPRLRDQRASHETAYQALRAEIATAQKQVREQEALVAAEAPLADLFPHLEAAEQRVRDYQRDIEQAQAAHEAAMVGLAEHVETRQAALAAEAAAVRASATALETEIDAQAAVVADTASAADALRRVEADIAAARARLDEVVRTHAGQSAALADLERQHARIVEACAAVTALDARLTAAQDEQLEWQLLLRALSRDGLPMLEIDAAGPTVSAYTNDLLEVCETGFTVELVTESAKADGKGTKDTCELKVYDSLRGGDPRDIGDLSGGEQILVEEAVKNALALYINSRNVNRIETCWRDETTGPLDPANARRYLEMLRRVRTIGGFHQILFVTHNADAARQADAQLRVAGGRASIVIPPYSTAA